jgi:hypothetical protein
LLEQAQGVGVVLVAQVGHVDQRGLLDGGGDRDDRAADRDAHAGADADDDGGVADRFAVPGADGRVAAGRWAQPCGGQ